MIICVKDAMKKISHSIDIYCQVQYSPETVRIIGKVEGDISNYSDTSAYTFIR